ncbi:hypothetical protein Tco_0800761 [Tanacetum coccineum]|uniref:Uncharacterized protein n=1 Tax=Tanacetum coccineum TaxID=301880 RepID=A0ABQ4ZU77_9ASTR
MNARSTPQNHSGEHGRADGGYHGGDYWRRWWISRWRLLEKTVEKRFTGEEQYGRGELGDMSVNSMELVKP